MSDDVLIPILFIWGISAFVAALIARDRERSGIGFGLATFFFLGPLGPGFALLAQHGEIEEAELRMARAENKSAREKAAAHWAAQDQAVATPAD